MGDAKIGYAEKLHVELVPVQGILSDARAIDFGAKKYSAWGWYDSARADQFAWSVSYGALLRHLYAWIGGEELDPESGLSHLDHVGANVKFLQTFIAEDIGVDDRP
jgi:hypothetical protein